MTINAATERWTLAAPVARSARGAVAAQHVKAAEAGAAMLDAGGNAVDAITATAYALGAVEPWMSGPGGSGFMVIWLAAEQRAVALDFQGVLPRGLRLQDYPVDPGLPPTPMGFPAVAGNANTEGYRSITVPGAVAGLNHALARFGTLDLPQVMDPAIRLAERGIWADWFTTLQIALCAPVLAGDPVSAATYLPGGHPHRPERVLRIPNLAGTLREIAQGGSDSFYRGALAGRIVADLQAGGSRISHEDLAGYAVREFAPMQAGHRGHVLHTCGEMSGGLRLRDFLAMTGSEMPAPPRAPAPETWLAYARALDACWKAHKIRNGAVTETGACTSSMAAVDAAGNMVALTSTLLNRFGSGVTLPGTGLLMNDAVSYFDPRPGRPTTMAGGKRINSSNMCPTVAVRDGQAVFALGASGGNLIMPAVAQVAALMTDFGMSLEAAVHHPRIDASFRGSVRADPRLGEAVLAALEGLHGDLEVAGSAVYPKLYACVSGVARDPATGICSAVVDPSQPVGGGAAPGPFDPGPEPPAGTVVRA
nr:gamma-glutamyltransferase [Mangrovicoccus algicola]